MIDLSIIAFVFIYFFVIKNSDLLYDKEIWIENIFSLSLVFLFWILLSERTKLYKIPRNITFTVFFERLLVQILIFTVSILLLGKVTKNIFFSNFIFTVLFFVALLMLFVKTFIFIAVKYLRSIGVNHRNVMFLEENEASEVLRNIIEERKDYGYKIFDFSSTTKLDFESLSSFWKKNGIHTVYLPISNKFGDVESDQLFKTAEDNRVHVVLLPEISKSTFYQYNLDYIQTQPILVERKDPLDYYSNQIFKRIFDVVFSLLVLIFVGVWLFPILALIIKLTSKGPVFFKQKRYGFHEQVFYCIKFRTMTVNDESSSKTTSENDARITKFGKFLRKTSLDEMPQFFNVLMGEMSVVGPRPHMLVVDDYYKQKIDRYNLRSSVYPGITGLAQVNGLRGDFGDVDVEMNKRVLADAYYVRNWTFILDFVIIFKTVFLVIAGDKNAK
jgi:putative colanic acid biosynthesis UDP-glucose lipid carrier transferase